MLPYAHNAPAGKKPNRSEHLLLVIDLVAPEMVSSELTNRLKASRSKLHVLVMSGYTDGAIVQHSVLSPEVHFLGNSLHLCPWQKSVYGVLAESVTAPAMTNKRGPHKTGVER